MHQTITMPTNWNLIFREELLNRDSIFHTSFEDEEGVFEINLSYLSSMEKFLIENIQLRGNTDILKDQNYSTYAENEMEAMVRAKEMAVFINQYILKQPNQLNFKQIPLQSISIDEDFPFQRKNNFSNEMNYTYEKLLIATA